jgi:hypothetical protein
MLLEGSSGAQFIMRLQRLQAAQEHDIAPQSLITALPPGGSRIHSLVYIPPV